MLLQRERTTKWQCVRTATRVNLDGCLNALSLILATLAVASFLFAWASWAHNGLDSPLTYASNGVATLLLIALGINEKTSSRPWISPHLRARTRAVAALWLEAVAKIGAAVALILLALTYYSF